ncbi:MAG TPA: hypothetical protein VIB00_17150 [Pyrinomonadaceae bacterium]|jgi:hypothetical protein
MQSSKYALNEATPTVEPSSVVRASRPESKFKRVLQTVWTDRAFRSALFAFALTRLIILFVFICAAHFEVLPGTIPEDTSRQPHIIVHRETLIPKLAELAARGDGNWYIGIARHGYERRAFDTSTQRNWAFFPVYPMLLWVFYSITGEMQLTAIALSSFLLLWALILMHKTATAFGFDQGVADRSVFYLAAFPTSYFFSLAMTESLFLLLVVASFYAARRDSWWGAGVLGAIASATRFTGILLFPTLCIQYWQQHRGRLRTDVLKLLLIPVGLLSFMYFLYSITGDALAFLNIQGSWARHAGLFFYPLYGYLRRPNEIGLPWDLRIVNFSAAVLGLVCGIILAKRREWSLALYTLASVIIALSSQLLQSQARYTMVVFPIFFVLAGWGRNTWVDQTIRAILLVLLGLMSALYAGHFSAAMA